MGTIRRRREGETDRQPDERRASMSRCVCLVFGCAFGAVACAPPSPSDGTGSGSGTISGDPTVLVGTFRVQLIAPVPATATEPTVPGFTSVLGRVYDGPTPSPIQWREAAVAGDCTLLVPAVPFCNPQCGGSAQCVAENLCQPYPTAQSVGTVSATGLRTSTGATEFSMEPIANAYQAPETLPYPAFSEGGAVTFVATGGSSIPALTLLARGVAPLDLLTDPIVLADEEPLTLSWTPAGPEGVSTIHVKLDISHHGGVKGKIECDGDDSGSLTLPATLLSQLKALGVAGFPTIVVTRAATGSATIPFGRVDLVISSEVERAVEIPGLVSCTGDADCESGQTCQTDRVCR